LEIRFADGHPPTSSESHTVAVISRKNAGKIDALDTPTSDQTRPADELKSTKGSVNLDKTGSLGPFWPLEV